MVSISALVVILVIIYITYIYHCHKMIQVENEARL